MPPSDEGGGSRATARLTEGEIYIKFLITILMVAKRANTVRPYENGIDYGVVGDGVSMSRKKTNTQPKQSGARMIVGSIPEEDFNNFVYGGLI